MASDKSDCHLDQDHIGTDSQRTTYVFDNDDIVVRAQERANHSSSGQTLLNIEIGRGLVEPAGVSMYQSAQGLPRIYYM